MHPISVIDRKDLQEALDRIDVLEDDQAVPYGGEIIEAYP